MSDDCCGKEIDVASLQARQRRVLKYVLGLNLAMCAMMLAAAFYSGSSALLSGTLDNLGDAMTYAMSLAVVGAGIAAKARVAFLKGVLIFSAAVAVGVQIGYRLMHPETPIFEIMGGAAILNLAGNAACLWLLYPFKNDDVNMASVWECSRNDVFEGLAVIAAAASVAMFASGWPDVIIAIALLALFLGSAARVLRGAWRELYPATAS